VLLIDDGIDSDCRLAGGTVADDELALATPNREQGVDNQNAGLWARRQDRAETDCPAPTIIERETRRFK
jgi:hypothetical protein